MNIKLISELAKMIKSISELTQKVINAGDPQKLAAGIQELNQNINLTYDGMRSVVINSKEFSDDEKIEKLQKLAVQEQEALRVANETIKSNRENAGKVALEVFKGLLTCGISFAPDIVKGLKNTLSKENVPIDPNLLIEIIEEENAE